MLIFVIISFLIGIAAILLALQNTAVVSVNFLSWTISGSLALVLLIALAAGALAAVFALLPGILKDKWGRRSHRKKINELEASLVVYQKKLEEVQARLALLQPEQLPEPPAAGPAAKLPPDPLLGGLPPPPRP